MYCSVMRSLSFFIERNLFRDTTNVFILLILGFFFILISGCIIKLPFCPGSCDDGNPCTTDICGQNTDYTCEHVAIDGAVTTCSGDVDECHEKVCRAGVCATNLKQSCAYTVSCDSFNIVSPSYEFHKSMNDMPSFNCEIRNNGRQRGTVEITAQLEGYSNEFEKTVNIPPGDIETVDIYLAYEDEFYDSLDAKSAMLKVKVTSSGQTVYSDSKTVQIEKSSVFSPSLGDESLIAMWVTYNDPCIEEVISEAKKFAPGGQFVGYMGNDDTIYAELAAVFYALYFQDIKYVSSTFTSTNIEQAVYNQDIRFPYRSLKYKQMNCIDGAVLYSAILEKLDYETGIAFVPGHAFVLVRDSYGNWIPIETTMTGDEISSFEDAVEQGIYNMQDSELFIIDVHAAIESGVTPMPVGEHECNIKDLTEEAATYQEYMQGYYDGGTTGGNEDCYDVDYGYLKNGACSYDNAVYCENGIVYWALNEECGSVYPNCVDPDYGYIYDGYCTADAKAYCEDGIVYWALYGECG